MDAFRPLTAADLALHRSSTQAIAARAMATAQNQHRHPTYLNSQGYKLTMTKHGFQAFQRTCPNSSFMEFVILGHCDASLDEIAEGLYASTTQAHRTVQALLYKHSFLDGAVLQVAETKTLQDPFHWFGIKYARVHLHAMFQPRDTVYAELSGTTVENGVRTLYQVRHSIEVDAFPPLHNVVRFTYEMGWVFTELPSGRVQFSIVGHLNPQGKIPPWLFNKRTALKNALNAATFSDIARLRRLVEAPPAPQPRARDPASSQPCHVCSTQCKRWRSCRFCGHVACKKCTVVVPQPVAIARPVTSDTSHPIEKAAYCKACFTASRLPSQTNISWKSPDDDMRRTSSSTQESMDVALTLQDYDANGFASDSPLSDISLLLESYRGLHGNTAVTNQVIQEALAQVSASSPLAPTNATGVDPSFMASLEYQRRLVAEIQRSLAAQQSQASV